MVLHAVRDARNDFRFRCVHIINNKNRYILITGVCWACVERTDVRSALSARMNLKFLINLLQKPLELPDSLGARPILPLSLPAAPRVGILGPLSFFSTKRSRKNTGHVFSNQFNFNRMLWWIKYSTRTQCYNGQFQIASAGACFVNGPDLSQGGAQ